MIRRLKIPAKETTSSRRGSYSAPDINTNGSFRNTASGAWIGDKKGDLTKKKQGERRGKWKYNQYG